MMAAMVAAGEKVRPRRGNFMSRKIRLAVIFLVLVNLVASAAYASPPVGWSSSFGPKSVLTAAWEWFASLVTPAVPQPRLQAPWEKAGSSMDPNGSPQPNSLVSGEMTNVGNSMDPDGNK